MIVFCDLDGTVADNSHRIGFIQSTEKDWNAFYSSEFIAKDKPIPAAIKGLKRLMDQSGLILYFLTGRPERTRVATIGWLRLNVPWGEQVPLLMRPDGDFRKADVYKEEHIQKIHQLYPSKVKVFIDDDLRNTEMYKRLGLMMKAPECWEHIL